MTIVWYSATGNTLALARMIAREVGGEAHILPLLSLAPATQVADAEAICIAVPVMCGRIAAPAARRLAQLTFSAPRIAAVATFGYTPGTALAELARLVPGATYFAGVKAPDSCLTVRSPLKEAARLDALDLPRRAREIASALAAGLGGRPAASVADRLSAFFGRMLRIGVIGSSSISLDAGRCTRCRICEKICPLQTIAITGGKAAVGADCCGCMACVNACPSAALHIRGEKDSLHRYRHPDIQVRQLLVGP